MRFEVLICYAAVRVTGTSGEEGGGDKNRGTGQVLAVSNSSSRAVERHTRKRGEGVKRCLQRKIR
jgi:hypothetical protein